MSHTPENVDPVCGMTVELSTAAARREYGGRTWYFCREAWETRPDAGADHGHSAKLTWMLCLTSNG